MDPNPLISDFEDVGPTVIEDIFNPAFPLISRSYTNVNLLYGPKHWDFKNWNPTFGEISRYRVKKRIGKGSYSEVYIGLQDSISPCAIKILRPDNNDKIRRELKILDIMSTSENVVNFWDVTFDRHFGLISIITEFCDNSDWMKAYRRMSIADIRNYMYRLLDALKHAHSHGIMHRDVKPSSVLFSPKTKVVKLADWGFAEFYHPLRKYSTRIGTKYYKSPELLLGFGYYDYSIDIWAAGIMFVEMLTKNFNLFTINDDNEHLLDIAKLFGGKQLIDMIEKYQIKVNDGLFQKLNTIHGNGLTQLFSSLRNKSLDSYAIELAVKMCKIDRKERITAQEALNDPFFASFQYDYLEVPSSEQRLMDNQLCPPYITFKNDANHNHPYVADETLL
ncbi:Casein kinase II subunit alpha [Tritrichomonas foetus]|uniref:non-specific serine/threonine protein kinase n=1 Tax=Tritrichomonas foetus TaxID=1144522 RepID=A0A1J4JQY6_9EUKA|nr:Casein kinase II subunit alpha [Tritrichomonas foetus]|eukprot:OHT01591.1 Casein kinase II subunit alpha [Tritrichomonas foetus]